MFEDILGWGGDGSTPLEDEGVRNKIVVGSVCSIFKKYIVQVVIW